MKNKQKSSNALLCLLFVVVNMIINRRGTMSTLSFETSIVSQRILECPWRPKVNAKSERSLTQRKQLRYSREALPLLCCGFRSTATTRWLLQEAQAQCASFVIMFSSGNALHWLVDWLHARDAITHTHCMHCSYAMACRECIIRVPTKIRKKL